MNKNNNATVFSNKKFRGQKATINSSKGRVASSCSSVDSGFLIMKKNK